MKKFLAAFMVALLVSVSTVAVVNAAQQNVSQTVSSTTVVMSDADLTTVSGGGFSRNTCTALKIVAVVGAVVPGGTACAVAAGIMDAIWCD